MPLIGSKSPTDFTLFPMSGNKQFEAHQTLLERIRKEENAKVTNYLTHSGTYVLPISEVDHCLSAPAKVCGKHGDCVSENGGYNCVCHQGHAGKFCDKRK
jgi:hypothetical protein